MIPTPTPALTDEQIERGVHEIVQRYMDGYIDPETACVAQRECREIIAAVVARAKREERERIADALIDLGEKSTGGTGDTARAYRYGIADAVRIATEATDDETH